MTDPTAAELRRGGRRAVRRYQTYHQMNFEAAMGMSVVALDGWLGVEAEREQRELDDAAASAAAEEGDQDEQTER